MRYNLEVERQLLLSIKEAGTQRWTNAELYPDPDKIDATIRLYEDVTKRTNDTLFHLEQMSERGFIRIWKTDAGMTARLLRGGRDRLSWHRDNTPVRRNILRIRKWASTKFRTVVVPLIVLVVVPIVSIILSVELMHFLGFDGRR